MSTMTVESLYLGNLVKTVLQKACKKVFLMD